MRAYLYSSHSVPHNEGKERMDEGGRGAGAVEWEGGGVGWE